MEEAWLLTWEWQMEAAAVRDEFVSVLPIDTPVERVMWFVEMIVALHSYRADELLAMASTGQAPYEATLSANDLITCGHHPWLEARKVRDVRVEIDEDTGYETIFWIERLANGQEQDAFIKRTKLGTLSFEGTWDRTTGKPKTFND